MESRFLKRFHGRAQLINSVRSPLLTLRSFGSLPSPGDTWESGTLTSYERLQVGVLFTKALPAAPNSLRNT